MLCVLCQVQLFFAEEEKPKEGMAGMLAKALASRATVMEDESSSESEESLGSWESYSSGSPEVEEELGGLFGEDKEDVTGLEEVHVNYTLLESNICIATAG